MIVDVVDGTYELFRHFYGLRRFTKGKDRPFGAVIGVLQMIEQGATSALRLITSSSRFAICFGQVTRQAAGIEKQLPKVVLVFPCGEHLFAIIAALNRVERLTLTKKRADGVWPKLDPR